MLLAVLAGCSMNPVATPAAPAGSMFKKPRKKCCCNTYLLPHLDMTSS
jgi:hypothetical protein